MKLRSMEWVTLGLGVLMAAEAGVYGYRKVPALQLVGMILLPTFGILVILGIVQAIGEWKRDRWRALLLLGLAVGGLLVADQASSFGNRQRDRQFLRALPAYEEVVAAYRSGTISNGRLEPDSLPPGIRGCCYIVAGHRDSTGTVVVEFWVDRGFPV
jgi:hypothetical protein